MAKKRSTEEPSTDEQIGFHKGSLSTLGKERAELLRIIGIVEQLLQMHTAALKDLGVDIDAIAPEQAPAQRREKPPIEDII